ncbi:mechanosensitive ion channel family protein [Fulvivirga sedimenti]|uniref:Mechanosensitive ion channel family protein n=1 Tax=Fulvivirga sedimenti TaxID=2879465 RepID=A0A9X1KYQ4_9BACT|nr:mechanosensitive ion channel family protein [Fulvivirga sedimenti]MCA6073861.1 mechanosensitive ion channel family protein [Fulvivirga sedimenti]
MNRILIILFSGLLFFGCKKENAGEPVAQPDIETYDSLIDEQLDARYDSLEKAVKAKQTQTEEPEVKEDAKTPEEGEIDPKEIFRLISFSKILYSVVVVLIGFLIIRFLSNLIARFAERSAHHRITIKGLIPIVRIFGWIIIIVFIVGAIIQPPATTIYAIAASVAIAVGFAAQDILKNMFGGIMILFDRPFQLGDKIQIGDHYGEVVEIGLRSTRVVTPGDSLVSIPNGELMNNSVSNANNGEANCQVQADIYLPLTADTQRIRQVAIEAAQVSRFIYLNKPIAVLFSNELKDRRSVMKMAVKAYVSDIRNEMAFKSDMTEIIMRELLKQHLIDPKEMF